MAKELDGVAALLRFQTAEQNYAGPVEKTHDAEYARLWLELFLRVKVDDCLRARCETNARLAFRRRDGTLLDVSFVRRRLTLDDDRRLLARLRDAARAAPAVERPPLRVVSDMDDTMMPGGHSRLGIAGRDTTAPPGVLFPGCAALHRELGAGSEPHYSTILTARPAALVRPLLESQRGRELLQRVGPHLAILPGASAVVDIGRNLKNILVSNLTAIAPWADLAAYEAHARRRYGALADHKIKAFAFFAEAYPDVGASANIALSKAAHRRPRGRGRPAHKCRT